MKTLGLAVLAAPLLSGCALFSSVFSPTDAAADAEPGLVAEARVVSPQPPPPLRRASMGPRGIVPCEANASLTSACRWPGDWHVEMERQLTPTRVNHAPVPETSDGEQ